jgi:DNA-binding MurR/RpiR family transcriptional regulator
LDTRNVLSILQSRLDGLPPSWKRLGDFLLTHLDQAVFLTASDLARHAKTSESSVVRFARGLGYQGYPELREDLQVLLREKLRPVERMVRAGGMPNASGAVVARVFELALNNIQDTRKSLDTRRLQAAATAIAQADTKHIIGLNASAGTAHLLGHHLGKIQANVRVHLEGGPMLFDALLSVSRRDVVVGISYPRYAKWTVELLRYARTQGARTIALTDSQLSPAAQIAEIPLVARVDSITFGNSYVGASMIVDALVALVLGSKREAALARLNKIDEAVREEGFFYGVRSQDSLGISPPLLESEGAAAAKGNEGKAPARPVLAGPPDSRGMRRPQGRGR